MSTTEALDKARGLLQRRWRRDALFFALAVLVLALDQLSKHLIRTFMERGDSYPSVDWPVRFHYVTNTGAAFGILQDQTGFLVLTTFIGLAAIILYYRYPPFEHPFLAVAIGMMLGGAVGNLADRIRLGEVTDFVDFPLWPAFNVADASIVVGLALLISMYVLLAPTRRQPAAAPDPSHEDPDSHCR